MSWSASFPEPVEYDELNDTLAPDKASVSPPLDSQSEEVSEQFRAALAAAYAVIDSGVVGGEGKAFSVSLSGHANGGHEPAEGWSNDCVNVSVSQR